MTDEMQQPIDDQRESRPGFLTVLCVLSFISTGLGFLSAIYTFITGPLSEEEMLNEKAEMAEAIDQLRSSGMDSFVNMMEKIQAMSQDINDHFYLGSSINLLVIGLGLYSVINMWKGRKLGFHLYIGYCLLSIAGLYIYISPAHIPTFVVVFNLILSGLFIFLYSRNLHWMKA